MKDDKFLNLLPGSHSASHSARHHLSSLPSLLSTHTFTYVVLEGSGKVPQCRWILDSPGACSAGVSSRHPIGRLSAATVRRPSSVGRVWGGLGV